MKSVSANLCPGYVVDEQGRIYLLVPVFTPPGFALIDHERFYPGGFGVRCRWELVNDDDPRITDAARASLGPDLRRVRDLTESANSLITR